MSTTGGAQRILQPGEIEALDRVHFARVRLPQPAPLFAERAARLEQLADGNPIADYLHFAARLVRVQQALVAEVPVPEPLAAAQIARAGAAGMPLLVVSDPLPEAWAVLLRAIVHRLAADVAVPAGLQPTLARLAAADDAALDALARQALADNVAREDLSAAPLLMAALQLVFVQRAAALDPKAVPYAEPATVCPVCGSAPVASVLRIGGEVAGHRYLHCGLCATEWHMVRIKCSHCESTQGVRYQGLQGADEEGSEPGKVVMAETCSACHTYRKIVSQEADPLVEPLADDLASLMLDLLMGETDFARASGNPLLAIERPLAV